MNAGTGLIIALVLVGGAVGIYYVSKKSKAPISMAIQAPSPAVAGIQALGALAGKGIDAWIASKANASDD